MRCSNKKCLKEFKDPLMLYNGHWVCPYCNSEFVPEGTFEITKNNQELFTLAQIYYLRSLKTKDSSLRRKYIDKTVDFCDRAFKLKHPEAYVLKAYLYDKDYVDLNLSETTRCKIAYKYYSTVCFMNESSIQVEDGVDNIDLLELKKATALLMMTMLSNFEESDKKGAEYNFDANMKKLRDNNINVNVKKKKETTVVDRAMMVYQILANCNKKVRAPLFGYYQLEGSELVSLFNKIDNGDEEIKKVLYKDVTFKIIEYSERGDIAATDNDLNYINSFESLAGKDRTMRKRILEHMEENPNQKLFVIFINTRKNGHKYLKKNQLDSIEKYIAGKTRDYGFMRNLINNSDSKEMTFFDDDIYYFMNKKMSVLKAVEELKIQLDERG